MSVIFQSEYPYLQIVKDAVVNADYDSDIHDAEYGSCGGKAFVSQHARTLMRDDNRTTVNSFYCGVIPNANGIVQKMDVRVERSHKIPSYSFQDDDENNEAYVFCEGEGHNQLILTDEEEIEAMRAFISHLDYITELTGEGEE